MENSNHVNRIANTNSLTTEDVVLQRKRLIQDVIDRVINKGVQKEYFRDLLFLNEIYSVEIRTINGVRIIESSKKSDEIIDKADQVLTEENNIGSERKGKEYQLTGAVIVSEDFNLSYNQFISEKLVAEPKIEVTPELIQNIIDRTVNREFGTEYIKDPEKLNQRYEIGYKLINGQRIYGSVPEKETLKERELSSKTISGKPEELKELIEFINKSGKSEIGTSLKEKADAMAITETERTEHNQSIFDFIHSYQFLADLNQKMSEDLPRVIQNRFKKLKDKVFS